jgi:hypothetical protein
MSTLTSPSPKLARAAVALAALWILTGALFKLFAGTPNDLPPPVLQAFSNLDPVTKFQAAIAIELVVVVLALAAPSIGWFFTAGCLGVFVVVLLKLLAMGEKSCGCFGTSVTMPPAAMLTIDSVLLLALLATRPWKALSGTRRAPIAFLLPLLVVAAAAPWWIVQDGAADVRPLATSPTASTPTNAGDPKSSSTPTSGGPAVAPEPPKSAMPRFVSLSPIRQSWVGKHVRDTELARWVDVDLYPQDAEWVIFRRSCDHCREHFLQLDAAFQTNPKTYVLIQVPDEGEAVVTQLPPHWEPIAELPTGTEWVCQTPWTIELEAGIVKRAYLEDGSAEDSAKEAPVEQK